MNWIKMKIETALLHRAMKRIMDKDNYEEYMEQVRLKKEK